MYTAAEGWNNRSYDRHWSEIAESTLEVSERMVRWKKEDLRRWLRVDWAPWRYLRLTATEIAISMGKMVECGQSEGGYEIADVA